MDRLEMEGETPHLLSRLCVGGTTVVTKNNRRRKLGPMAKALALVHGLLLIVGGVLTAAYKIGGPVLVFVSCFYLGVSTLLAAVVRNSVFDGE